jgi:hypothetical protein
MQSKITLADIDNVLNCLAVWLADNSDEVAELLAGELVDTAVVVDPNIPPEIQRAGVVILAVFTARAAMRKALRWFDESRQWSDEEKTQFLSVTIQELLASISNCNNAMYHLDALNNTGSGDNLNGQNPTNGGDA